MEIRELTSRERELLTTVFKDLLLNDGGQMQSMRETACNRDLNRHIRDHAKKYGIDLSDIDTTKL